MYFIFDFFPLVISVDYAISVCFSKISLSYKSQFLDTEREIHSHRMIPSGTHQLRISSVCMSVSISLCVSVSVSLSLSLSIYIYIHMHVYIYIYIQRERYRERERERERDGNYTRMLRARLNKSWKYQSTKKAQQMYDHLSPILQNVQVGHAWHCLRSKVEHLSNVRSTMNS